jgi:hypothetical protein
MGHQDAVNLRSLRDSKPSTPAAIPVLSRKVGTHLKIARTFRLVNARWELHLHSSRF